MILAYEAGLDLVEVNIGANPPVVKIMDYGKYRYSQEKQESKQKSKSRGPELKEIRLSAKISQHDFDFKAKQAQKFLLDGDKVKVGVKLIGREMMFSKRAFDMIENFRDTIGAVNESKVERLGNQFSTILINKK
ncbi:MAG: bacterial translation initiation factor-3 [Candidatus Berkelbacteria bacterium]|nr:bacterial translation initiation factor-3 [Candidatus Berkelbacteria bacterium]